ncbi:MAG: TerB family tellurite resistance protein [Alphaproteobacteria bacterium]|jgi:uncharacterized tellurite resistance protein B-like protein|nr:TerB family tellurite resistance protein [Alphaproteobacteria bacterium]
MFDRLKKVFGGTGSSEDGPRERGVDDLQLAAAALLTEAARMDDDFGADEQAVIARLLHERFSLREDEVAVLMAAADKASTQSVELFGFTREIKDAFDHDERIQMIEMLWEVVYADGEVHDHEANLLRRIAGLIYVSDRENGDARKRVLDRTGTAS